MNVRCWTKTVELSLILYLCRRKVLAVIELVQPLPIPDSRPPQASIQVTCNLWALQSSLKWVVKNVTAGWIAEINSRSSLTNFHAYLNGITNQSQKQAYAFLASIPWGHICSQGVSNLNNEDGQLSKGSLSKALLPFFDVINNLLAIIPPFVLFEIQRKHNNRFAQDNEMGTTYEQFQLSQIFCIYTVIVVTDYSSNSLTNSISPETPKLSHSIINQHIQNQHT